MSKPKSNLILLAALVALLSSVLAIVVARSISGADETVASQSAMLGFVSNSGRAPRSTESAVAKEPSADVTESKSSFSTSDLLGQLAQENEVFAWAIECEDAANGKAGDASSVSDLGNESANQVFANPAPGSFRQWFASDTTPQTWENYRYWLEIFYGGNFVSQGWVKTGHEFVADSDHPQAVRYVNVLGRVLASEWSKHNRVRKVGNMDMYRWGKQLNSGKLSLEELARVICDRLNGISE